MTKLEPEGRSMSEYSTIVEALPEVLRQLPETAVDRGKGFV